MKKCGICNSVAGLVVAGAVLAVPTAWLAKGEEGLADASLWAASLACGLGLAYVLKSLVMWIKGALSLKKDPLAGVDVADRSAALEFAEAPAGGHCCGGCGLKPLLRAWGSGATGPQVARMAATQFSRGAWEAAGEAVAVCAVLSAEAGFAAPQALDTWGTALLALSALAGLARLQGVAAKSRHVEGALLSKIGVDTAAGAAEDFAGKAGKAVEAATAQLGTAVGAATKDLGAAVEAATRKLAEGEASAAEKMASGQNELARQLEKVSGVASSVEKLLQLQKSVDGTLAGVSATSEFKETLVELRRHLAEADQILKDARKPRKVRLVESGE